ncbi:hypothetical protein pb186bvf_006700 [Paramecium bursaria]
MLSDIQSIYQINKKNMEEVHFKFDVFAKIPFQVRLEIGDKYCFRPINQNDGFLYDLAPQATKNILNQKGYQKGKLILEDLDQIGLSEYAPPVLSKQFSNEIKKSKIKEESKKLTIIKDFQLQNYSQVFLSILIHENDRLIELDDMIKDLDLKVKEAQTQTKHIIIVIINSYDLLENQNFNHQFFDECFGKIVKTDNHIMNHLILNKYQDSFSLMQFIYEGLAKYFKPQYLYIQETKFQLKSNIFKDNLDLYGIVCPQKQYNQKINNNPLLLNYLQQLQFYTDIQNKFNSYNYDALNCFQNYELLETHLIKHLKNLQQDLLDPNMHHVNQQICKQLNFDKIYVIQAGELEYNSFYELTKYQVINLQQEVNFMMNEYSQIYPSEIKQTIMKTILLIDYFSLSSYLYIIIILPYYFILDNTQNQELKIFIPIIPAFILVLIILMTMIMSIIFQIDEYQVTDKEKPILIYVKQVKQIYHYLIDISDTIDTLPESRLIQNEDMIINLKDVNELVENEEIHKIKTNPQYLFNYINFLQKWDFVLCFYNFFYLILSVYLIYSFYVKDKEHSMISTTIVIFIGFGLFVYLILLIWKRYNLLINTKNLLFNFIQINIIYDFSFNYTKSVCLERNYYKLKQFQQRIIANFTIIFLYIMIEYGQGFKGRIISAITGYYVIRKLCQIILLLFNSQKNQTRKQLVKLVQDVGLQLQIEKKLIDDQSQIVDFYNIILNQTLLIHKSMNLQKQASQPMQPLQQLTLKKVASDKKEELQKKAQISLNTNPGNPQWVNQNQDQIRQTKMRFMIMISYYQIQKFENHSYTFLKNQFLILQFLYFHESFIHYFISLIIYQTLQFNRQVLIGKYYFVDLYKPVFYIIYEDNEIFHKQIKKMDNNNSKHLTEVHFRFDLVQKIPFQVIQEIETKKFFRPINSIDGFLYDLAPQSTQNLLNQKAIQQNKLIQQEYEQMTMSRLYFDPENQTNENQDDNQDQSELQKFDSNTQLQSLSQIFLSILIMENDQVEEIEYLITDLKDKIEKSNTSTQNIIIIIINADNLYNNKNNYQDKYYEECYGKIRTQNEFMVHLLLNKQQDSFSLMQFIYEGLAKYFQPQYLYIQETKFKLDSNIFKDNLKIYGIVCPLKTYQSIANKDDPLLLSYLIKQKLYTDIQNIYNSFNYDAFNCFQNYELVQTHLGQHLKNLQEDVLDANAHRVNQEICKQLNKDKMFVIQVGKLDYNQNQELTKSDIINLHQEIKLMMNQFSQLHPSAIKQTIMKIILLIDYFSLSSYLFIIIILPYYFMLENTQNQVLQIFIPIIPGFILILIIMITLIMSIVFKIDEYQVTDKDKAVSIYVKQVNQSYHYLISNNQSETILTLPESKLINNNDMIINLNDIDNLVKNEEVHKIQTKPKYLFNYLKFLQQSDIIFCFYNFFYLILSIYLIIANILKGGDYRKISIIIIILIGFVLLTFVALLKSDQNNFWINIKTIFFNFIQINIIYDFSFNYTKSSCNERNYYKLKQFQQRIIANFIIIFLYIMIDYGQGFGGRVICAITGYYAIRQICQIILIFINIQKNETKQQENRNFQDSEQKKQIMKRLTNDQSKVVKLYNAILQQTQRIHKSVQVENAHSQLEQSNDKSHSQTVLVRNQQPQHQLFDNQFNFKNIKDQNNLNIQNIQNIQNKSRFSQLEDQEDQQRKVIDQINHPSYEQIQENNAEAHTKQIQVHANQQFYQDQVSDHDAFLAYNNLMGDENVDSIPKQLQKGQSQQDNKTFQVDLKQSFNNIMEQEEDHSENQSNQKFLNNQEKDQIKKSDSFNNDSDQAEFLNEAIKGFE